MIDTSINNMKLDAETIYYLCEVTKKQNESPHWMK